MGAYVDAVDGDIVLKFKNFLLEEEENEISVSGTHKFTNAVSDTVGEGHGSNRGKEVNDLSTGDVLTPSETGNCILLYSDAKI